jgi:hypothetical protein
VAEHDADHLHRRTGASIPVSTSPRTARARTRTATSG